MHRKNHKKETDGGFLNGSLPFPRCRSLGENSKTSLVHSPDPSPIMLDGYDRNQEERARGPSMDIDEKSTAFSQAQISTPVRTRLLCQESKTHSRAGAQTDTFFFFSTI